MARRHILLTESRPNLQHSLGLILKQAEYRVSLAENTEEALTLISASQNSLEPVDLLIVDLDSASPEICRIFMRTLSASPLAIAYLILAEEIHDQTDDALKAHGCLGCITKPFLPEILLRSVRHALEQQSPQDFHQPERKPENTSSETPVSHPG